MEKKKGILQLTSHEKGHLHFTSDDGTIKQGFVTDQASLKKYFCNSSVESAKEGVRATSNGASYLSTDQWNTRQQANMLSGISSDSFHFC